MPPRVAAVAGRALGRRATSPTKISFSSPKRAGAAWDGALLQTAQDLPFPHGVQLAGPGPGHNAAVIDQDQGRGAA